MSKIIGWMQGWVVKAPTSDWVKVVEVMTFHRSTRAAKYAMVTEYYIFNFLHLCDGALLRIQSVHGQGYTEAKQKHVETV
jgi:hypothetical protein